MKISRGWFFSSASALAFALTLLTTTGARATEPKAPSDATKAEDQGKEVTLKGTLGCGKCSFKTTTSCQNILKVKEGGKEVMYYLAANPTSEKNHEEVCDGPKSATVKGTVTQEEAKDPKKSGKTVNKKILTASEIKIN
jgi:hypothetical protein